MRRFSHLKYLAGWLIYIPLFFLTEALIPAEACYPVHVPLDDLIPFCEWFIIPYVGWYFFIAATLVYLALRNADGFKRFQVYLTVTQMVALAVFVLFPTRQDLRPAVMPRDNLLTDAVALLYRVDTNTGVCPSLHVAFSLGMASAWCKEREVAPWVKGGIVLFVIMICLSVSFLKQHSVVDILAAIPLCLVAEWIAYKKHRT